MPAEAALIRPPHAVPARAEPHGPAAPRDAARAWRDAAIVHDWLTCIAGGEKVVAAIGAMFGRATLYTLFDFLTPEERAAVAGPHPVVASRLNALPGARRYYRHLLMPATREVERFDLRAHDIVVSSSAALAKGVITGVDQPHVAYIHSPPRYAWDMSHEYLAALGGPFGALKRHLAHRMLHRFRLWDLRSVNMADRLVANSRFVARRIEKVYGRDAEVVHPPVDTRAFTPGAAPREDWFVTASRLVPYKRVDLVVAAFSARPDLRLRVIGSGPELAALRRIAGPNVEFCGHLPQGELREALRRARAFVFAAMEDFGIAPVEAQACGTPVIAFGAGGALETVRGPDDAAPSGVFFEAQTVPALLAALARFEADEAGFDPRAIRAHAERFSEAAFRDRFGAVLAELRAL